MTDKRFRPDAEYYRAYRPVSKFIFVGEKDRAVHLSLTCRLPKSTTKDTAVKIAVNGNPQAEIDLTSDWTTWDIEIPDEVVIDGLNEIALRWPVPNFDSASALEQARLNLVERKFPDFFPVFGEIHSFTASAGRQVSIASPVSQAESSLVQVA